MHEASIVQELLAMVARQLPAGSKTLTIQVSVGRLTSVSPDAMQFYFETMRDDTLGPQARLEVQLVPLRARCADCGAQHELEEATWTCPGCGAAPLQFENGDELDLLSVEVEDAAADVRPSPV
jgi:hydrogenase nickel incorporation protein HypA/HybF